MRTADRAEVRRDIDMALAEAEQARADYDAWMAAWRARNGHVNGFDRDTGLPIREPADLVEA
jgi:hypothetical protein